MQNSGANSAGEHPPARSPWGSRSTPHSPRSWPATFNSSPSSQQVLFALCVRSVQVKAFEMPFEVKIFVVEAKKLAGLPNKNLGHSA
jgi:hypothetical protein